MNNSSPKHPIIIVMGVSGCGKSTIAAMMANSLDFQFLDADDLHPPKNKQLMSAGVALTDENRIPWLQTVRDVANSHAKKNEACVIACSALKQAYREILSEAPNVCYVFLDGSKSIIQQRMSKRTDHFMPESLLDSQFDALERPTRENHVVTVDVEPSPDVITKNAVNALKQANLL